VPTTDKKWLAWGLLALIVAAVAPLVLFYALGLDSEDDKRFAAVSALAGVTVTACASLIGALVHRASERRLEREHADEEARLRLDAAMRAGELFNATGASPANSATVASGLLALTQLDRADLAVALLVDLWDSSRDEALGDRPTVSDETAILVLDAALRSSNANAQLVAAELLCRNATRLDITQSLNWPSSIDGHWNQLYGVKTKVLIVDALVHMALVRERTLNALQSLAVRLYCISEGDPDPNVKGCVGMLLAAIVPALEQMQAGSLMEGPSEITLDDIRRAAAHAHPNPDRVFSKIVKERSASLRSWSADCDEIDYSPGALAGTA